MEIILKKGFRIGFLAAEEDNMFLNETFIDNGILSILKDTSDPRFILLGRTGSGKTAIVEKIKKVPTTGPLNPEDLSFQYLCNSNILNFLSTSGASFDIFYKFLWKHICILELIRIRYEDQQEVDRSLLGLFDIQKIMKTNTYKKELETKTSAKGYLGKYGDKYWISSDARIKTITNEFEEKVKADAVLGSKLGPIQAGLNGSAETSSKQTSNVEISQRLNSIVHEYLVSDLNKVIELMSKNSFSDKHKKYYIVIDDLDKNWMPDSKVYIEMIKTLLDTAKEINRKLENVKIIVSIREDALFRMFENIKLNEPQREKWNDVILKLQWDEESLKNMVESRLNHAFKSQYTSRALSFTDVFPQPHKKSNQNSFKFILDRTFYRPRDVIDFINTTIESAVASSQGRITWSSLNSAEKEYSLRRYDSVLDEWKAVYPGIDLACRAVSVLGSKFNYESVTDDILHKIIYNDSLHHYFQKLQDMYLEGSIQDESLRQRLLKILFVMGILGVHEKYSGNVTYSYDLTSFNYPEFNKESTFHFHKMFRPALSLSN